MNRMKPGDDPNSHRDGPHGTYLVTGAGRGLGREIVKSLAMGGARVIAVARTEADLGILANEHPGQIETWVEDVTSMNLPKRIEALPALDGLVNNAGSNRPEPFVDVSAENLDHLLNLNVRSAFLVAQASARVMQKSRRGSIVNITSQMGHVGSPGRSVYCMTKHAIEGLTKAMAVELGPLGIRVNSVAPTFVETPMTAPMLNKPEFRQFVLDRIPLGRIGQAYEVAAAVSFLLSDAASLITGTSLLVDGGWTAQ
jgi:NAD(P)-dependent dehydrogenase (short-subunit alcohol dehydrogenase family)